MSLKLTTPSDREIVATREFNAPRAKVWEALTRPDLLRKWLLGPPGWEMTECQNDVRVGGTFRHAWTGPGGVALAMHGVYREVAAPDRMVRTETFDTGCAPQMGEQVGTLVLTEQGGRTLMTLTLVYPSKEARDGAAASGMEHGMAAGYNRLDEVLAG
jgi:uncharacterized protein YndB with AHSA1/START domain